MPEPGNPQALNRYAYTLNNPVKYTDPSGHFSPEQLAQWFGPSWREQFSAYWQMLLLAAELGDVVRYGADSHNPLLAMFVRQANSLVLWEIGAGSVKHLSPFAKCSDEAALSLYRSRSANPAGGPSHGLFGEGISPEHALSEGSNVYRRIVFSSATAYGPEEITLPRDWHMGRGAHVEASSRLVEFQLNREALLELGVFAAEILEAEGPLEAKLAGAVMWFGLALDLGLRWDTDYFIDNRPGTPSVVPAPAPPESR